MKEWMAQVFYGKTPGPSTPCALHFISILGHKMSVGHIAVLSLCFCMYLFPLPLPFPPLSPKCSTQPHCICHQPSLCKCHLVPPSQPQWYPALLPVGVLHCGAILHDPGCPCGVPGSLASGTDSSTSVPGDSAGQHQCGVREQE